MDLVPSRTSKKFLCFEMTPATGCFGNFLPLQTGVVLIALLDILGALVFETFKYIVSATVYSLTGIVSVPSDISASAPIFAIAGVFGIRNMETDKLHFYSLFKQIEFVVRTINLVIFGFNLSTGIFCFMILYSAYTGYCAFVVWSTYELVKSDEGMLAKHGQGFPGQQSRAPNF
jgi:hypothetical protein